MQTITENAKLTDANTFNAGWNACVAKLLREVDALGGTFDDKNPVEKARDDTLAQVCALIEKFQRGE